MGRIALTDGSGRWFDPDKAQVYNEKTQWDGHNNISLATGSERVHETIYVTKSGLFILETHSNYLGKTDEYELISKEQAAIWFSKQEFNDEEIPPVFLEEVKKLEIE